MTTLAALAVALVASACWTPRTPPGAREESPPLFRTMEPRRTLPDSDAAALELFAGAADDRPYRLGPGDVLFLDVWGREELGGRHVVGPDGQLSLPVVGSFPCAGLTRDEAAAAFAEALEPYYADLAVTVRVEEYVSHRLAVLGDVNDPGSYPLENAPRLLDVLSRAGGVSPQDGPLGAPVRCSVFRGNDTMIRLELDELLERGNTSLNIPLRPQDVVVVKHATDEIVYVLGEVNNPGMYPVKGRGRMSVLDALALAGGLTEDSQPEDVMLIRTTEGTELPLDIEALLEDGDVALNVALVDGDILFVPRSGLAHFGYFMRQISPFALLVTAAAIADDNNDDN